MEVTELYSTAKGLIDEVRKIQPEIKDRKDQSVFVVITDKQHTYAGVDGVKIIKGEVLPASAEYNTVLAMVSEDETVAKQAIKLNAENGSIIRPETEGVEMLCRANPANKDCYIVLSADEAVKAEIVLAQDRESAVKATAQKEEPIAGLAVTAEVSAETEQPAETAEKTANTADTADGNASEISETAGEAEDKDKSKEPMEETDNMSEEVNFEEKFGFAFDDTPAEDAPPVPTLADQKTEEQAENEQNAQNNPAVPNGTQGDPNAVNGAFPQGMPNGGMYDPSQMMNNPMMNQMNNMQGMNQMQQMQQQMQQMLQQLSQQNPQMAQVMMEQFNKMNQMGQQMNQMNQMNQMMNQFNQMNQMMNQMNQNNPQYAQPIAQPYGYNPNAGSMQYGQTMYQNANPYYQGGTSQPLGGSQPLNAFPAQSSHYGASSSHYMNSQSQPVSSVAITSKNGSRFKDRFNKYVNDEPVPSSSSRSEGGSMSMDELMKKQRDQKKNAKMSSDFKKKMKDMGY